MREIYFPVFFAVSFILAMSLCSALTITASVPAQYQTVLSGNPVYVHTEVKWPENNVKVDLVVEYTVKDVHGNDIAYLKVLRAIETQTSFLDSVQIPDSAVSGQYTIYEDISYPGSFSQQVASGFTIGSPGKTDNSMLMTYVLVIAGIVLLIAVLAVIELFVLINRRKYS